MKKEEKIVNILSLRGVSAWASDAAIPFWFKTLEVLNLLMKKGSLQSVKPSVGVTKRMIMILQNIGDIKLEIQNTTPSPVRVALEV